MASVSLSPALSPAHARRDATLGARAARGNPRAFAALYERHHQALYRYCRSIVGNDEDARDALQNAVMRAFDALQREERDFPVRPWLFRIVHNEAISLLRERRHEVAPLDAVEEPAERSLERAVAQRAALAQLRADLAELPERHRSALVLRELSGLSHEEIAVVLDTTPRAIKQVIFEARRALAEQREGRELTCDTVCRAVSDGDGRVLRGRRVRAHLRDCGPCAAFAGALRGRRQRLAALAGPVIPLSAAGVLAHSGSASAATATATAGAGGALGASSAASGAALGASSAGGGLIAAKVAAVTVAAAMAAGGAVAAPAIVHSVRHDGAPQAAPARAVPPAAGAAAPAQPAASMPAVAAGAATGSSTPAHPGTPQATSAAAAHRTSAAGMRAGRAAHAPHTTSRTAAGAGHRPAHGPAAKPAGHGAPHRAPAKPHPSSTPRPSRAPRPARTPAATSAPAPAPKPAAAKPAPAPVAPAPAATPAPAPTATDTTSETHGGHASPDTAPKSVADMP